MKNTAKFSIQIGEKIIGDITFLLFNQIVPKTAKNFLSLCSGEKGKSKEGFQLHYKGSQFHRIIPGFVIQGGDFTHFDGRGGYSIYGPSFDDENFKLPHSQYCLSMANCGPNTNSSQFFITLGETPWLDGRHVVFGKVFSGFNVIHEIEKQGTKDGTPKQDVTIINSCLL